MVYNPLSTSQDTPQTCSWEAYRVFKMWSGELLEGLHSKQDLLPGVRGVNKLQEDLRLFMRFHSEAYRLQVPQCGLLLCLR